MQRCREKKLMRCGWDEEGGGLIIWIFISEGEKVKEREGVKSPVTSRVEVYV